MLMSIMMGLGITLLLWVLYRGIKGNKEAFSKENMSNSFMTMGIIAVIIILVVGFAVILLK